MHHNWLVWTWRECWKQQEESNSLVRSIDGFLLDTIDVEGGGMAYSQTVERKLKRLLMKFVFSRTILQHESENFKKTNGENDSEIITIPNKS